MPFSHHGVIVSWEWLLCVCVIACVYRGEGLNTPKRRMLREVTAQGGFSFQFTGSTATGNFPVDFTPPCLSRCAVCVACVCLCACVQCARTGRLQLPVHRQHGDRRIPGRFHAALPLKVRGVCKDFVRECVCSVRAQGSFSFQFTGSTATGNFPVDFTPPCLSR